MDAPRTHDRTGRLLRRYQILDVLQASIKSRNGNSPSERQLLDELRRKGIKISYGALRVHLMQLQADGAIDRLEDGTMIMPDDSSHSEEDGRQKNKQEPS